MAPYALTICILLCSLLPCSLGTIDGVLQIYEQQEEKAPTPNLRTQDELPQTQTQGQNPPGHTVIRPSRRPTPSPTAATFPGSRPLVTIPTSLQNSRTQQTRTSSQDEQTPISGITNEGELAKSPNGFQNGPQNVYNNRPKNGFQNGPRNVLPNSQNGFQSGAQNVYNSRPQNGFQNGPLNVLPNRPGGFQSGPQNEYNSRPQNGFQNGPRNVLPNRPGGFQSRPQNEYNSRPQNGFRN